MNNDIKYNMLKVFYQNTTNEVLNCEDWPRPKKANQWKDGRSAKEFAKAWFRGNKLSPPEELLDLLSSELNGLELIKGIPELVTDLPVKGEGRNHDMWLLGKKEDENVTICIEAKTDEPFGNYTVGEYYKKAIERISKGEKTGVAKRIDELIKIVESDLDTWAGIQYQLLTALSGTIRQAKKHDNSNLAVFIVYVLETDLTDGDKLKKNNDDYKEFLRVIGIDPDECSDGELHGPVILDEVECLVGKVVTRTK